MVLFMFKIPLSSGVALMMQEFLSKSTIHGVAHISTAKSWTAKVAWIAIVTTGFAVAGYLITNAYGEWSESPVSTVVTTRLISDLQFPEVTVCPPKGSNTLLNQAFKKVADVEVTPGLEERLKNVIHQKFFVDPSKAFAK